MFSRKPLRGMTDFYPDDLRLTNWIVDKVKAVVERCGYEEFEAPLLEPIEIYAAKSSEELVNEQAFVVEKKPGERLILRPELTPSLARMVARRFSELEKPIRWFSNPTCYRYERPQRGRKREFKQFNVDLLGEPSLLAEAEVFGIVVDVMAEFGVTGPQYQLLYNNRRFVDELLRQVLDVPAGRVHEAYKLLDKREKLDEEAFAATVRESFDDERVVDGLLAFGQFNELDDLPFDGVPSDFENNAGFRELKTLEEYLDDLGISKHCKFSPAVIRGLDYYTGTVFEVFDAGEENRRALFGGGRYDDLMSLFSRQTLTGVGFGMGVHTLRLFLETYDKVPNDVTRRDWSNVVLAFSLGEGTETAAMRLARKLRAGGISCLVSFSRTGLGKQLGRAAAKGVRAAIIVGREELAKGQVSVKDLGANSQATVEEKELVCHVRKLLEG
ncbi:MAG: histidine--tRNA ligase [Promethearchaeota archaeon]